MLINLYKNVNKFVLEGVTCMKMEALINLCEKRSVNKFI